MHSPTKNSPKGEIHNLKDLQFNKTFPCHIFGIYVWVDPRKDPDPEIPPENYQAAIQLEDGTLVHLQPTWEPSAIRSEAELIKYHQKEVVVFANFVLSKAPPSPGGTAYMTGPCMFGPISISSRKAWDRMNGGELK